MSEIYRALTIWIVYVRHTEASPVNVDATSLLDLAGCLHPAFFLADLGAMATAQSDLSDTIEAAERAVWQALTTGDAAADRAALAPDFLGVYADGFADRAAHLAQLEAGPSILSYSLSDITTRALGPDHALIAYRADYHRAARPAPETMYVSSIWQRTADGWRNIFSQDTPAQP